MPSFPAVAKWAIGSGVHSQNVLASAGLWSNDLKTSFSQGSTALIGSTRTERADVAAPPRAVVSFCTDVAQRLVAHDGQVPVVHISFLSIP